MPVVMGTAGHIDHGKTTLVRALTGIECDRLGEEKERGITIELGFAFMPLPDGDRVSLIDMPGHERFIRNMVAGTAGIDFVMLVIAADEGVMPQTREHLEICQLLGVSHGLVALTKIDTVDADWLEMVRDDVQTFLQGSFLEDAPIYSVSSQTGEGLDTLRQGIYEASQKYSPQRRTDLPRLPVDRVFTLHGHGTIVTGTLLSGAFELGQNLVLMPSGKTSRVRGLQSHGKSVEKAQMGFRTAANLPALEVADIDRGEVLTLPDRLVPATTWIVDLHCVPSSPRALRQRLPVHFYHGTKQVQARLLFRDREKLQPGERALCQIQFDEPMVGVSGDRFVIRCYSPLQTVAGGKVVYPLHMPLHKRDTMYARKLELLTQLAEKDEEMALADVLAIHLELAGTAGVTITTLSVLINEETGKLEKAAQGLSTKQQAFLVDKEERLYIACASVESLGEDCLGWIEDFHKREKLKSGVGRNALVSGWGKNIDPKLVHFVLNRLQQQGKIAIEGDIVRLVGHTIVLQGDTSDLYNNIMGIYTKAGNTPPNLKDVLEELNVTSKAASPVLSLLQQRGDLVKVSDIIYYAGVELEKIKDQIRVWFETHDDLTLADLRDLCGVSRKYCVALLEYFDAVRFTLRTGDKRILREKE